MREFGPVRKAGNRPSFIHPCTIFLFTIIITATSSTEKNCSFDGNFFLFICSSDIGSSWNQKRPGLLPISLKGKPGATFVTPGCPTVFTSGGPDGRQHDSYNPISTITSGTSVEEGLRQIQRWHDQEMNAE